MLRNPATAIARNSRTATMTPVADDGETIVTRMPESPPAVAAITAIRASGNASASAAAPIPASSTPGAWRWEVVARPRVARTSAATEPRTANRRRYSDPTSELPPITRLSAVLIAAAAMAAPASPTIPMAADRAG